MGRLTEHGLLVSKLPTHTKKETLAGRILDCKRNRIDGFTLSADLREPNKYGYMVGTGWGEFDAAQLRYEEIRGKVNQLMTEIGGKPDLFIGAWNHEGKTVVEVSEWIPEKDMAIHVGKLRSQYSIWDIAEGEEIVL